MKEPGQSEEGALVRDQVPQIKKGKLGQTKATFQPKDFLEVEYEVLEDRVKANYILTQLPPLSYQTSTPNQYALSFQLTYPWGAIIPQANEDDGSISFTKDKFGDGKEGSGEILKILSPMAKDGQGKIVSTFLEMSTPLTHDPLPSDDGDGFPEILSLNLFFELDGSETYPITIDPVVIDSTSLVGATAYGHQRHILRDNQGNGNLIALFNETGAQAQIWASKDGGISWTNQGPVFGAQNDMGMAQDKSGNLHAVGSDTSDKPIYVKTTVSRTNGDITGVNSSTSINLAANVSNVIQRRPTVIVDSGNDLPMAAWAYDTSGGVKSTRIRFSRATADPTVGSNWKCTTETSCTSFVTGGVSGDDNIGTIGANTTIQPVLVQMPGEIEPLTNSSGNLYIYINDAAGTSGGDLRVAKATIQTGGTPNFKWSTWSTATEQDSDLTSATRVLDLTAARDIRNNRIVFAFTTDADTDSKDTVPVTQIRYRSSSDDSTTDISPATTFSATGTGTDIGDEFQLTVDPVRNEYLLFYANSSNNIEYRKAGQHESSGTFGWKDETLSGVLKGNFAVDIYSERLAYVVGSGGLIYKWNGTSWSSETPSGESNLFYSVDIYSTTLAYAVGVAGRIWKWNGTSWTNESQPDGETNIFYSVDIYSTTLAYAVGAAGRIWKWNGSNWTNETPGAESDTFRAVDIFSTSLAWAVGDNGTAWKWNGTSWTSDPPTTADTSDDFESVDVYSGSLAIAVGGTGTSQATIYRWNGSSWTNDNASSGNTNKFFSVDAYSSTLAYAVGASGRIYRWNGGSWTNEQPAGETNYFRSIDVYSTSLALTVGDNGRIYRWNGNSWINETPVGSDADDDLKAVDIFSPTLAYAVGGTAALVATIYKWTGGTINWPVDTGTEQTYPAVPEMKYPGDNEPIPMLQTLSTAFDVEFERVYPNLTDANSPMLVRESADDAEHLDDDGGTDSQSITGTTIKLGRNNTNTENYHAGFRFQGVNVSQGATISSSYLTVGVAQRTGTSAVPFTIYGEDREEPGLAYAVGINGLIRKWDGSTWTSENVASSNLYSVDIYSRSLAFAVGYNSIWKWNGTSWTNDSPTTVDTNDDFRGVDIFSSTLAFAVGGTSTTTATIYKWNGTSWTNDRPTGETNSFYTVDIFSASLAYAVGQTGRIWKWNGTSWTNETPAGETNWMRYVDIYSTSLAIAVGESGRIYRWNGTNWTNETSFDQPPDADDDFASVDIFSTTLAIASGGTGTTRATLYRWNGTSWTNERPAGETRRLRDVDIYSTSLAYVVGQVSRIYKWNGTSWTNESIGASTPNFESVDIYSTTLAIAGGVGASADIYRWNGSSWTSETFGQAYSVDIYSEKISSFDTSNSNNFVGNRTRTSRYKSYSIDFPDATNGVSYRFDVTEMVQEIVCRGAAASLPCIGDYADASGNWASGNALTMLLISNDSSAADNYVNLNAQDGTQAIESTLEINLADASGKNYSKGIVTSAPTTSNNINNLAVSLSETDFTDVGTNDAIRDEIVNVVQSSATRVDTPAFYFKKQNSNNTDSIDATWDGQSSIAASDKTVRLEVLNSNTGLWESESTNIIAAADTDFTLTGATTGSNYYVTEYYGGSTSWTNDSISGEFRNVLDVDIYSTYFAFAVGGDGRIFKWNGTSWSNSTPGTDDNDDFKSVDVYSSGLAFAVGGTSQTTLYKWNGTSWTNDRPASANPLQSVDIFSTTLAFAVGDNGDIWKWNGTSWGNDAPGTVGANDDFRSVDVFSTSLAFAVGGTTQTTVYKWNGTNWSNDPISGETDQLRDLDIFSSTLAHTVGDNGTIWRWNGTSWVNESPDGSTNDLYSVDTYSSALAMAGGGESPTVSRLYRWNGSSWVDDTPASETRRFAAVDIYSPYLAIAGTIGISSISRIYRWNGTSWTLDFTGDGNPINSIDVFSDSLAFAVGGVGDSSYHRIYKWASSNTQYFTYWRIYQDANDGTGALGESQSLKTDQISFSFSSAGGGGPTLNQLLRHGNWFNSSGVEQSFTF